MELRPLIRETLKLLTIVGLNPFYDTLIYCILEKCVVLVVVGTSIDIFSALALNYGGIDSIMQVMIFVATMQINIKMLFFIVNKVNLKLLINNTTMFWKGNFLYFEEEERNEKIFSFVKSCMLFHCTLMALICFIHVMNPLLFGGAGELPWESNCSQYFNFEICFGIQTLSLAIFMIVVLGFDLFYVSLITNIICELKLLKRYFPNLRINPMVPGTDKEAMDDLRKLIIHHNLILECVKIMKYMYSLPFLWIFFWTMFGTCFSLVTLTSSAVDIFLKLLSGIATMYYLSYLLLICAFGTLLADESVKITNEVYNSKWWIKTQPELRKALIMVMRRANKPEILTAGGILEVNLQTFTMVIYCGTCWILRSSFSFFTFIQVMYDD